MKSSQSCSHPKTRQIATTHGGFCLDCGHLDTTALKNKKIIQMHKPDLGVKTKKPLEAPAVIIPTRAPTTSPTKITKTIKISVADITPKKKTKP